MARSLLSLVVEGPEADLVWSTYKNVADDGCDTKTEMDEEDMQAPISDVMRSHVVAKVNILLSMALLAR